MHELLVTTRLPVTAQSGIEAFGLVPLDGEGPGWRAVAVVQRRDDGAEVLALVAVDDDIRRRLLDGVTEELRAAGCAQLWVDGNATAL